MRFVLRRSANYLPSILVAGLYAVAAARTAFDPLESVDPGSKAVAYQTFAGIAGAVLGLGVVSFSVLFAVSPRTRLATVVAYSPALRVWLTGAFVALGVALIGFGILIPLDDEAAPSSARFVAVALVGFTVTALAELVWLVDRSYQSMATSLRREIENSELGDYEVREPIGDLPRTEVGSLP